MLQHLYSSCFRYGSNRQSRRLVLVEDNISAPTEQESLQATLEARLTIRVANGRSVTKKTSKAFTLRVSHSLTTFAPRVVYGMTPIEPSAQIPHAIDLGDSRTKTTSTKTGAANTQWSERPTITKRSNGRDNGKADSWIRVDRQGGYM
jgi:hypothetical protein